MAVKANITIDQGTSFETTLDVTDDNGDPINLTGYTGAAQMRKHYTSSNSYSFAVAINPTAGVVTLTMNAASTSAITAGRYVYDCELTSGSTISRVLEGIVTVTPQVTR
jgi:hypothetical protein